MTLDEIFRWPPTPAKWRALKEYLRGERLHAGRRVRLTRGSSGVVVSATAPPVYSRDVRKHPWECTPAGGDDIDIEPGWLGYVEVAGGLSGSSDFTTNAWRTIISKYAGGTVTTANAAGYLYAVVNSGGSTRTETPFDNLDDVFGTGGDNLVVTHAVHGSISIVESTTAPASIGSGAGEWWTPICEFSDDGQVIEDQILRENHIVQIQGLNEG